MRGDPILAIHTDVDPRESFEVEGGLHYIKGNRAPYFSLTCSGYNSGGADHATILKHFPRFADLAAMHLSDINGKPMHAVETGWYYLAGAIPGHFGTRYHMGTGSAPKTERECLETFARHCRIKFTEAVVILEQVRAKGNAARNDRQAVAKRELELIMADMVERWKREADACIENHKLVVYGDPWNSTPKESK